MKNKILDYIIEIRPWQWYKQSLILIGILISESFYNPKDWLSVILAFLGFCMVAGGVYVFNDLNDIEEDRNHPKKKHRPIASGSISYKKGLIYASLLSLIGLLIYFNLGIIPFSLILFYLIQNIFYSKYLKDIVIIDIMIIALGMVIRAMIGFTVIDTTLNISVLVIVFLAALLLASGKRKREIEEHNNIRKSLEDYTLEQINHIFIVSMCLTLATYIIFSFKNSKPLSLTIPFSIFATLRYQHLIENKIIGDEPKDMLLDKQFTINLIIWTLSIVFIIHLI